MGKGASVTISLGQRALLTEKAFVGGHYSQKEEEGAPKSQLRYIIPEPQ